MAKVVDITGQTFGSWTVLARSDRHIPRRGAFWVCRCKCGAEKDVLGTSLRVGSSLCCGKCGATPRPVAKFAVKPPGSTYAEYNTLTFKGPAYEVAEILFESPMPLKHSQIVRAYRSIYGDCDEGRVRSAIQNLTRTGRIVHHSKSIGYSFNFDVVEAKRVTQEMSEHVRKIRSALREKKRVERVTEIVKDKLRKAEGGYFKMSDYPDSPDFIAPGWAPGRRYANG